eukprot:gene3079-3529_t
MLMFLLFGIGAQAQVTTSSVNGKVRDAKGIAIPGASVLIVHVPTGTKYGAMTTAEGSYRVNNLNPGGPYKITVTYIGYNKQEKDNLNLSLGADQRMDFTLLDEGQQLSEVVVAGTRGGTKMGTGTRIGEEQIKNLPTVSRSLTDVTRLTPQGSKDNSFVGTNFRYNNVTIDGAINNDAIGFSPSLGGQSGSSGMPGSSTRTSPVSLDAIQDVSVLLAPYDVKIGNFTGGSVNAVTRSGTNDVSGSIYGYGRNAALIGRNKIGDNSKEPSAFHDYQTGVRVGFPIIKNKLFFFTNEEITRRQDPVILGAGSADMKIITADEANSITNYMKNTYSIDPGSSGDYNIYAKSNKFFNRLDWNINDNNQLTIRNNTITSTATNLERDQANFRFGGIDYKQTNNQSSTVAELKSRLSNSASNSLVIGYSNIHDYRDPTSNPAIPQIEISSRGGTIFLGTDREASIFNMKQKTFEFTDNFTLTKGKHTFTFGTHNELYNITYGFVNAWNGRVAYGSVADFLANQPSRVRTNYNYSNNTRDYIMSNPPAEFKLNMYSLYAEDQFQITDRFKLTYGIRFDLADLPNKQPLSDKTTNAPVDPNYGNTFTYTKPKDIKNDFLGQVQVSPRIGFNYDINGDQKMILRGGSGLFTGRVPFAWLGYAYYNNGVTYGAFDKKYNYDPANGAIAKPVAGSDPIRDALNGNGEAGYVTKQGTNKVSGSQAINPKYSNAYLLSNTNQGYRYSITGQISKSFPFGLDVMAAYTYGQSKDITNGIRNSMESNWQLNQSLNPNNPGLAYSNFDIRNRIVAQSGSPYSYGMLNGTINGTGQNVSLMYVPNVGETSKFIIADLKDSKGAVVATVAQQIAAFDAFIDGDKYLKNRRGQFTERNAARTPWNVQADFRFSQDIVVTGNGPKKQTLTFTYDIVNLTNLLNKNWGVQYFSPNTYNSMASVGLINAKAGSATAYPTYNFDSNSTSTYSKDFFASRFQMQFDNRLRLFCVKRGLVYALRVYAVLIAIKLREFAIFRNKNYI